MSPLPKQASASSALHVDLEADLKRALVEKRIPFTKIATTPDSTFIITLKDGQEVLMSSEKDFSSQVASLQVIVTRLTMEGKRFVKLDLRFDKPVISFTN